MRHAEMAMSGCLHSVVSFYAHINWSAKPYVIFPFLRCPVEDDEQTAAFLRDCDLKRLPESSGYTKDLDPKEVLKLAVEMCVEQGDEERAQMAMDKLKALKGRP